ILREPLRISASGRTDAGVHAHAQCFHADVPDTCRMSPDNWRAALNAHLPASIRILEVQAVDASFHARFSAVGKEYEYLICTSAVLSPFLHERAWHLPHEFDVDMLEQTLRCYEGEHDFRRFAANRGNEPENPPADFYLRTIYSATLQREGDLLRLRLHGNGFMYRMVRLLVGTAHQVSRGRMSLDALRGMLENPLGDKTRYCAPAGGLYLRRVFYT
ncbi:MAG: tRNA pseudouridine(38-40) synthase TruA, partial [Akkermansia sp.]|nr:tRNA pseudouridine(38-40) synthase TruA [Akkermansia sp.]